MHTSNLGTLIKDCDKKSLKDFVFQFVVHTKQEGKLLQVINTCPFMQMSLLYKTMYRPFLTFTTNVLEARKKENKKTFHTLKLRFLRIIIQLGAKFEMPFWFGQHHPRKEMGWRKH